MSLHVSLPRLVDLRKGRLSPRQVRRIAKHLDGCSACRESSERLSPGLAAMESLSAQETPELAWDHIGARIYWSTSLENRAKVSNVGAGSRRKRLWRGAAGAAGLAVAVAVVFFGDTAKDRPELEARSKLAELVAKPEVKGLERPIAAVELNMSEVDLAPMSLQGLVVLSKGSVFSDGQPLVADALVVEGQRLSSEDGLLVVQFGDRSAFRIAANSNLFIERLDEDKIVLRVQGRVDVELTHRLPGQEFSILAGRHEVSVRGTVFRVNYSGGDLDVKCTRGEVVVKGGPKDILVGAGRHVEILRNVLTTLAQPIDPGELVRLGRAMRMPMMTRWEAPGALVGSTALLEVRSDTDLAIAVDGQYVGDGPFMLRTSVGRHQVAMVEKDGTIGRGRWLTTGAGKRTQAHLIVPHRHEADGGALRKAEFLAAIGNSQRVSQCLAPLEKQGLLFGSSLAFEVGITRDGSQSFLNLLESNLSSGVQDCMRDALDMLILGAGPKASLRLHLSY